MFAKFLLPLLFLTSITEVEIAPRVIQTPPISFMFTEGYLIAIHCQGSTVPVNPILTANAEEALGPSVMETSWVDAKGRTQTVKTPCGQFSDTKSCAKAHQQAVADLESYYPIKKE